MVLIGFYLVMVGIVGGINFIYQFWIYIEVIKKCLDWFEVVMNMFLYYCVYYGINLCYFDCNYVGIFIVWDKMFGIFQFELEDEDICYGVVKNLGIYNLFCIVFYEWILIVNDMCWVGNWCDVMMFLLVLLGWFLEGLCLMFKEILECW